MENEAKLDDLDLIFEPLGRQHQHQYQHDTAGIVFVVRDGDKLLALLGSIKGRDPRTGDPCALFKIIVSQRQGNESPKETAIRALCEQAPIATPEIFQVQDMLHIFKKYPSRRAMNPDFVNRRDESPFVAPLFFVLIPFKLACDLQTGMTEHVLNKPNKPNKPNRVRKVVQFNYLNLDFDDLFGHDRQLIIEFMALRSDERTAIMNGHLQDRVSPGRYSILFCNTIFNYDWIPLIPAFVAQTLLFSENALRELRVVE